MRFRNFFRLLVTRTVAISVLSAIVLFGEEPRTAADAPLQVANSQQNEVAQAIKQLADEMRQERRPPDSVIPFGILGPLIALVAFAFELYQRRHHERTGVILFGGLAAHYSCSSASLRACALLMDRFPFSTSETTLLDPNTGIRSRCRKAPIFVDAGLPHILGFVVFLRTEGGVVEVVLQE